MRMRHAWGWILGIIGCAGLWGCTSDLDRARALRKAKSYTEAAKMYEKVLKEDKKNVTALQEVTELYCSPASYNGLMCLDRVRKLHKKKPSDKSKTWLKRALFKAAYERTTSSMLVKAEEYLKQYLALEPSDGKAHYIGAMIKYRQGKKPPIAEDDLMAAIGRLNKAIKNSSASTTFKLDPNDKSESPLQWEAHKMIGNIYEMMLALAISKHKGKAKFVPNAKHFAGAAAAYKQLQALNKTQPNKDYHFLGQFQLAMLYANYKKDLPKSLELLLEAEKSFPKSRNVVSKIAQIYAILAAQLKKKRGRRARKQRKAYEKKSKEYAQKFANLPAPRKKK